MSEPLNRDEVIEYLQRLGSDQDEEVLEAARQVHARITEAGLTWEDLLAPEDADHDDDDDDYEDDEDGKDGDGPDEDDEGADPEDHEPADEDAETPAERAGKNADSLALIDALLARPGNSEAFKEELNDYKTDIAEGEFEEADRRYLRALQKRLSKQK